jgi:Flp pilus assembly protein TadG
MPREDKAMRRFIWNERGTALLETALTLPLLLLVSVGIFEFGRAFQMEQIITNAAREGARLAVMPGTTKAMVDARVQSYLSAGKIYKPETASVALAAATINIGAGTASGTRVTVSYPFSFMVLNPVVKLVVKGSTMGNAPITMSASAEMRNE